MDQLLKLRQINNKAAKHAQQFWQSALLSVLLSITQHFCIPALLSFFSIAVNSGFTGSVGVNSMFSLVLGYVLNIACMFIGVIQKLCGPKIWKGAHTISTLPNESY